MTTRLHTPHTIPGSLQSSKIKQNPLQHCRLPGNLPGTPHLPNSSASNQDVLVLLRPSYVQDPRLRVVYEGWRNGALQESSTASLLLHSESGGRPCRRWAPHLYHESRRPELRHYDTIFLEWLVRRVLERVGRGTEDGRLSLKVCGGRRMTGYGRSIYSPLKTQQHVYYLNCKCHEHKRLPSLNLGRVFVPCKGKWPLAYSRNILPK